MCIVDFVRLLRRYAPRKDRWVFNLQPILEFPIVPEFRTPCPPAGPEPNMVRGRQAQPEFDYVFHLFSVP
jgi:hypothetical protein